MAPSELERRVRERLRAHPGCVTVAIDGAITCLWTFADPDGLWPVEVAGHHVRSFVCPWWVGLTQEMILSVEDAAVLALHGIDIDAAPFGP